MTKRIAKKIIKRVLQEGFTKSYDPTARAEALRKCLKGHSSNDYGICLDKNGELVVRPKAGFLGGQEPKIMFLSQPPHPWQYCYIASF